MNRTFESKPELDIHDPAVQDVILDALKLVKQWQQLQASVKALEIRMDCPKTTFSTPALDG